jgi:hypothetical protein
MNSIKGGIVLCIKLRKETPWIRWRLQIIGVMNINV